MKTRLKVREDKLFRTTLLYGPLKSLRQLPVRHLVWTSFFSSLGSVCQAGTLRQLSLREKTCFRAGGADEEHAFLQVDGTLRERQKKKKKTTPQVCVYNPHSVVGCGRRASNLVPLQHIQAKQHIHRLVFQNGERTREEVSLYLDLSWTRTTKTTQFLPIMQYHIYVYTYSSLAQIWGADHQLMITDVTLFFYLYRFFWTRRQRYQPK